MRRGDIALINQIRPLLRHYIVDHGPLRGLVQGAHEDAFLEQIVESLRRVKFVESVRLRGISSLRANPHSDLFDPIRAAIMYVKEGRDHDEACWLVFLSTLIGKHLHAGWVTTAQIYGALGDRNIWSFQRVQNDPMLFRQWLEAHQAGIQRKVGNHRKYLSLSGTKPHAAGSAVETYVTWVNERGTHKDLFDHALQQANQNPMAAFEILFESMTAVDTFGRTGRFDYLTMIGKVGLASLIPDSPHLIGATGPLAGAHLLFDGDKKSRTSATVLDRKLVELGNAIQVRMDVLEDAVCNWQKNPSNFVPFRG
ncbi:hypothetical protein DWU98_09475 [Dyella monticola]|uniref:Alpha-glutamyl/putrescinyl thymine pyrophosphorylase clade 3 domain-containing protein n=1 Tax=Dyella monticola TaxID=1927958 RepID=A0A370X1G6_9GAMM|nr:hypothetical protein [Dyella monticola]RDS82254.1 hypothetical protein DWU98_09475 [Dyella monticola]